MDTVLPDWDAVFLSLSTWQRELSEGEPSVTLIARKFSRSPWAVLASTLLSLRTKDAVTLSASNVLLAQCPSPGETLKKTQVELEKMIYPVGFYKTKAMRLLEIARIVMAEYDGLVPSTLEELLGLPGVGRKTANLVLIEAFDKDGICVDTHVHRITNRTGWVNTKNPNETEAVLRKILPRKYWKGINESLVLYGQRVCKPVKALCSLCVITKFCAIYKNGISKN